MSEHRQTQFDVNALWDLLDRPEARAIRDEAQRVLDLTISTASGRTFRDGEAFRECLRLLAILSCDQAWAFLIGGGGAD